MNCGQKRGTILGSQISRASSLSFTEIVTQFKIHRPGSGGDLPQTGEFSPFPVARRVNSFQTVAMDDDMEGGNLGPFLERPRTFPDMRSKPYTPLVSVSILIMHLLCETFH